MLVWALVEKDSYASGPRGVTQFMRDAWNISSYNDVLASLEHAEVPLNKAKRSIERLMKQAKVGEDQFDAKFAASILG